MRYTEEMILRSSSGYCMPFEEPTKQDVQMSVGYGEQKHPVTGETFFHHGIDFSVNHYLLSAVATGTVSAIGSDAEHGIYQTIRYGKYEVTYRHLSNVFANFSQNVKAGQTIAYIQSQMEKLNGANKEEVVEETKKEVMNMLKKTIRPEFLNRIDETIMFLPLTEKEIKQIVLLQIKSVQKMLAENGVELEMTEAALDFLSKVGYDPEFGARPVKRAIQRYLLNDLSKKLLSQEVDRSKAIIVDASGDGLVFRN